MAILRITVFIGLMLAASSCGVVQNNMLETDFEVADLFFESEDGYRDESTKSADGKTVIFAKGYGALDNNIINKTQQRLLAMRVSEVDAYRALAERVRGLTISGNTKIEDYMTKEDHLVTMVEAYIRNATVVSQMLTDEGVFETTLSLKLEQRFLDNFVPHVGAPSVQGGIQGHSDGSAKAMEALEGELNGSKTMDTQSVTDTHYKI